MKLIPKVILARAVVTLTLNFDLPAELENVFFQC